MSKLPNPSFLLLYVDNPLASADFYSDLLGRDPVESSPTFVMMALSAGTMLGLWARSTVEPRPAAAGGGTEVAFVVDDAEAVRTLHTEWSARKRHVIQTPCEMDFGFTFVATDLDGHRLRVFAPKR
jgi:predicted enzyme related to lactoylglutathione lyase